MVGGGLRVWGVGIGSLPWYCASPSSQPFSPRGEGLFALWKSGLVLLGFLAYIVNELLNGLVGTFSHVAVALVGAFGVVVDDPALEGKF